ncbi:MAG: hypothetical protein ABW193_09090 [Luteibacter sp.]
MRRFALPALALLVASLAGCATDVRNQALNTTLMNYAGSIRWGDFTGAQAYIDPDYAEAHPMSQVEQSRLTQLRVTGYDEGAGPRPDGEDEVVQVVQINVVNINTQAERSIVDRQRWHYDREKKKWRLMTGLPDFSPH